MQDMTAGAALGFAHRAALSFCKIQTTHSSRCGNNCIFPLGMVK